MNDLHLYIQDHPSLMMKCDILKTKPDLVWKKGHIHNTRAPYPGPDPF